MLLLFRSFSYVKKREKLLLHAAYCCFESFVRLEREEQWRHVEDTCYCMLLYHCALAVLTSFSLVVLCALLLLHFILNDNLALTSPDLETLNDWMLIWETTIIVLCVNGHFFDKGDTYLMFVFYMIMQASWNILCAILNHHKR